MNISEAFPSKYISAPDLKDRNVRVRMAHVTTEKMSDGNEKPVLYFQGTEKGMVLNKTNATTIADAYGDNTDDWNGEEIILFPVMTDFGGKPTPAVRCRKPTIKDGTPKPVENKPAPPAAKSVKDMADDEVPF